jgi:hypothetical protein
MDSLGFWALRLDVAVGKLSEVVEIIELLPLSRCGIKSAVDQYEDVLKEFGYPE